MYRKRDCEKAMRGIDNVKRRGIINFNIDNYIPKKLNYCCSAKDGWTDGDSNNAGVCCNLQ